jgi:hydrocephalus-inducing protein
VIIRNLGEKTTKWNLELPQGFFSNQKEGVIEPGKNEQILMKFYPAEARLYRNWAKLEYDKLIAYVELVGFGQLSNVYLSKPVVSMEESYIGLQSQQTLHIINKSNVKVNFEWRAFSSEK